MRMTGLALTVMLSLLTAGAVRADDDVKSATDTRVAEWWPTAEEKQFDQIGWANDLRTARKLATEHNRPIFLLTMDGRVNLGRC